MALSGRSRGFFERGGGNPVEDGAFGTAGAKKIAEGVLNTLRELVSVLI